jgi:hypothetical protein
MNPVYAEFFTPRRQSLDCAVSRLPRDVPVEIEAIAVRASWSKS